MKRTTKKTHFTIETRLFIEEELDKGTSVTDISKNCFVIEVILEEKYINIEPLNFQHHLTETILVNTLIHVLKDILIASKHV